MNKPIALFAAALIAAASLSSVASAAGVEQLRGKARPVMIFAPSAGKAAEQLTRLRAGRAALDEREMPVFVVTAKAVTTLAGARAPATISAADLRKTYGVADDAFAVVVVGKDGGEKLRSAEPVTVDALVDLVDRMPMRRQETR